MPEAPLEFIVDQVNARLPTVLLKTGEHQTNMGTTYILEKFFANTTIKQMISEFWAERCGTVDNITVSRMFNGTCTFYGCDSDYY